MDLQSFMGRAFVGWARGSGVCVCFAKWERSGGSPGNQKGGEVGRAGTDRGNHVKPRVVGDLRGEEVRDERRGQRDGQQVHPRRAAEAAVSSGFT